MEKYQSIVGRKLSNMELKIVELFGSDEKYEFYKDENGNLGARIK